MTEPSQDTRGEPRFGVVAEIDGRPRPVVLLKLPFGRLIDEIIVPYNNDQPFFIDGVPVTRERIKVVELGGAFQTAMREFENMLNRATPENQRTWGDQYETRFEHILRMYTQDVTAQVLKAYSQVVKPRLKDYIPRREEIISAATTLFIEAMKVLSNPYEDPGGQETHVPQERILCFVSPPERFWRRGPLATCSDVIALGWCASHGAAPHTYGGATAMAMAIAERRGTGFCALETSLDPHTVFFKSGAA